jgi:hypothetical protein
VDRSPTVSSRISSKRKRKAVTSGAAGTALVAYMHVENLENRVRDDGRIDRQTLDYLRAARAASA